MNEKYIVEGPALAKLLRENRIRIARGELTFTPLVDGDEKAELDDKGNKNIPTVEINVPAEEKDGGSHSEESKEKEIEDSKDVVADDSKDVVADDSKDVAPVDDSKDVAPVDDSKEVAPEEESKDLPPVETKSPKKSKK